MLRRTLLLILEVLQSHELNVSVARCGTWHHRGSQVHQAVHFTACCTPLLTPGLPATASDVVCRCRRLDAQTPMKALLDREQRLSSERDARGVCGVRCANDAHVCLFLVASGAVHRYQLRPPYNKFHAAATWLCIGFLVRFCIGLVVYLID